MKSMVTAFWFYHSRILAKAVRPPVISVGSIQNVIKQNWKQFDHPLIRRKDIDWNAIEGKKYAIKLNQKSEIRSERLKKMHSEYNKS